MDAGMVERALADLAAVVEYPAAPDLAVRVRERLRDAGERDAGERGAARAAGAPGARPGGRPVRWARVRVAVAVVVLAALVVVAFPGPRAAVARFWDLVGVRIVRGTAPSSLAPAPSTGVGQAPGGTLQLGRLVGLEEAGALLGRRVPLPAGLGRPDSVWYAPFAGGSVVSVVYSGRPGLPASPYSGVGLLLSVISDPQADVGHFFKKVDSGIGAPQLETFVDGGQSWYWFSGPPHALFTGYPGLREGRQAGNTLLWQRSGLTYRLEAQVSRAEALRLARSLG